MKESIVEDKTTITSCNIFWFAFLCVCTRVCVFTSSGPSKRAERGAAELEGECEGGEKPRELTEGGGGEPEPWATEEPEGPEPTAEQERRSGRAAGRAEAESGETQQRAAGTDTGAAGPGVKGPYTQTCPRRATRGRGGDTVLTTQYKDVQNKVQLIRRREFHKVQTPHSVSCSDQGWADTTKASHHDQHSMHRVVRWCLMIRD